MQLEALIDQPLDKRVDNAIHRDLTSIADTLHMSLSFGQSPGTIADTLRDISCVANKAFADEESLMTSSDYSMIARHRKQHQALLYIIDIMIQDADAGNKHVLFCTLDLFEEALSRHESLEDTTFGRFLASMNVH